MPETHIIVWYISFAYTGIHYKDERFFFRNYWFWGFIYRDFGKTGGPRNYIVS